MVQPGNENSLDAGQVLKPRRQRFRQEYAAALFQEVVVGHAGDVVADDFFRRPSAVFGGHGVQKIAENR